MPFKGTDSIQIMDFTSTVDEAKIRLSIIYCDSFKSCIVIYDDNKVEITDDSRKLNTIPNFARFIYFDIDRKRQFSAPSITHETKIESKLSASSSDDPPLLTKKSPSSSSIKSKEAKTDSAPKSPAKVHSYPVKFEPENKKEEPKARPLRSQRPKIRGPVLKYNVDDDDVPKSLSPTKLSQPEKSSSSTKNQDSEETSSEEDESETVEYSKVSPFRKVQKEEEKDWKAKNPFKKNDGLDESIKKENEKLKKENQKIKEINDAMKNEYEKLKKENQEIKEMNEEMGKEVELIKSANKKLKKENQTINEAYNELKEDFEKIETENKSLQHQISDLKSKKVTPKSEIKPIQPLEVESIENLKDKILIGEGGQSRVYRVTREEYYVLKELKTNNSSENFKHFRRLLQEFEIINMLHHKNIIQTYGIFFGDETHPPLLLLEFCPRNLKQAVEELNDMKKVTIIYEISLAMNEIHKLRIIHRDLKPENILLDAQDHVKLSDFGISYVSGDSLSSKTLGLGTLKFMAPEILNENPHYDEKIDVYSFGVVVFFILTNGDLPRINLVEVGNGKKAPIPENINEISKELILRCWSTDPNDRPSFNEIIEYITNHQFKMIDGIESETSQIMKFLSI